MSRSYLYFVVSLIVCSVSLSVCGAQYISPDPAFVGTDGNVTLTCHHPSHPNANIRWVKGGLGGDDLSSSALDDPRLSVTGSQLSIEQFHASEHAGQYSCIMDPMEEGQTVITCPAQVKHARIPTGFLLQPDNTTAYEGMVVVLHCSPHPSVPPAVIVWTHNRLILDPASSERLSVSQSGNLYILDVVSGDAGKYRCIASNPVTGARRRSNEVMLTIEVTSAGTFVPPSIAVEPVNTTTALEGSRVVLECAGRGYPQPRESWEMSHSRTFPSGARVEATGELVIDAVILAHAGTFICRIKDQNHTLIAERHVDLIVRVPPRLTATPPSQFTTQRGGNTSAIISCSATASEPLQLFILHNGTILQTATGRDPTAQATPPSDPIGTSHTFQCIALNSYGCDNFETTVTFTDEITPTGATPTSEFPDGDPFTPSTASDTSLAPGSGSTPVVPMLDLRATSPFLQAHVGDHRMSSCEVTGSADLELTLTWVQGTSRNLHSEPVDGITVRTSAQVGGTLTSVLEFETIMKAHDGPYTCHASIKGYDDLDMIATIILIVLEDTPTTAMPTTATPTTDALTSTAASTQSEATVPVSRVTTKQPAPTEPDLDMKPPFRVRNLQLKLHPVTSDIVLTWEDPHTSERAILGFKINWDHPNVIEQVARVSLAKTATGEYSYTISRNSYIRYNLLAVYVWAYNFNGDGPLAEVEIAPSDIGNVTPMTVAPPTSPRPPALTCNTTRLDPTMFRIDWPETFADVASPVNLSVRCAEARSQRITLLAPPINASHYIVEQALPSCTYSIEVTSAGRTVMCMVRTQSGQVFSGADVKRLPNGTVQLTWHIPPEIRDSDLLTVEIDWGDGWVLITDNVHIPLHFEPKEEYNVRLRFRHAEWTGYLYVDIPPAAPEVDPRSSQAEIALIYSVTFGGVAVGCAILVAVILALKYIQWSRRENDKVTNFREKSKEEFQRMSLKRSSVKSVKEV